MVTDGERRPLAYIRPIFSGPPQSLGVESCLVSDFGVRRFAPKSAKPLISSESDSAALAPLQALQSEVSTPPCLLAYNLSVTGICLKPGIAARAQARRRTKGSGSIQGVVSRQVSDPPVRGHRPLTGNLRQKQHIVEARNTTESRAERRRRWTRPSHRRTGDLRGVGQDTQAMKRLRRTNFIVRSPCECVQSLPPVSADRCRPWPALWRGTCRSSGA
jgi:hypothetical protein